MGTSSSKFKKFLFNGDEFAAMQIYLSSPELQKNLNPNISYGENHNHDTAMHYAAKHGMKHLLRAFLQDLGGNPNKRNGSNQTSLHAVCLLGPNKSLSAMERRAACVSFLVQWRGDVLEDGNREKIDLSAQDQHGNTALHLAAASGLEHCVLALLTAGSPLFAENKEKQTPCDLAVKYGHVAIAHLLETKMVFDGNLDVRNEDELSQGAGEEVYCGLRAQDLQEAKDQLLVETSDMLQVPLFTAEALLRDNEWSRELLLDKWMKDAVACCQLAGVEVPPSALLQHSESTFQPGDLPTAGDVVTLEPSESLSGKVSPENQDIECGICLMIVKVWEQPNIKIPCQHNFCAQCWESYLASKILEGMHHDILCPAFQCSILVPLDVIERLVSPDLTRRYLHFDIKAFVESNKCIKWCPVAGCGRAVKLPEAEHFHLDGKSRTPLTSHAVDCGNGHFFCWECLGEAHAPSGCAQWRLWLDKVKQVRPEELDSNLKDLEVASNCLWLVTNSKPCPNCKSPIQKTEGCNHIKCSKCKFDFCWVCLEAWKKHSSATGGYFRCNRFPAASKAEEKQGVLYTEAVVRSQQIQDLNRFIHYYTRFKNHENSRKLEEPILTALKRKMEALASTSLVSAKDKENFAKFIEDGVRELLKARRVLCGSYVYGFYLDENGYNRTIFEFMQNELETVTEKLSEMMARPYLKTPWQALLQMTALARRKRHEFIRAVSKGLIPPETPPSRRHRRRRFPGLLLVDPTNDVMMSHAIAASLRSLNPTDVWVKDAAGRHNNLTAICEWPGVDAEAQMRRAMALSLMGKCRREGCARPRARNTRTQELDEYCSLWCAASPQASSSASDESMDLAIALEMSRLQMIEDTMKRANQSTNSKARTNASITQTETESELNKAIAMSLSQQQTTEVGVSTENSPPSTTYPPLDYYRKTKEDITVDYFLKSLAGQHNSVNLYSPDAEKALTDKESAVLRPQLAEDGRFEIGDIHEIFNQDDADDPNLRRAHSTGDIARGAERRDRYRDSRYHLDSDHSSQHEDKPEDVARNILSCQSNVSKLNQEPKYPLCSDEDELPLPEPSTSVAVSDNFTVDMEVCHIMSSEHHKASGNREPVLMKRKNSIDWQTNDNTPTFTSSKKIMDKRTSVDEGSSRSESVKNLIEQVKSTLKAIESKSMCTDSKINWQQRMFEFDSSGGEFSRHCPERASTGKIKNNPDVGNYFKLHSGTKSVTTLENLKECERRYSSCSKKVLLVGSDKSLNESHKRAFKAAGGKILHKKDVAHGSKDGLNTQKCGSNLRIRIAKSPVVVDSSNEYETETGIPKSPTLFISGVSISRTPEPCSPASVKDKRSPEHKIKTKGSAQKNLSNLHGKINSYPVLNFVAASIDLEDSPADNNIIPPEQFDDNRFLSSGRQSRSSSLTVPKPSNQDDHFRKKLNISCGAIPIPHGDMKNLNSNHAICFTPPRNSLVVANIDISAKDCEGVFNFGICNHNAPSHCFFKTIPSMEVATPVEQDDVVDSSEEIPKKSVKSKSAAEPEREREVFRFPKSSTDGALSSVLHVQESNLSSDDFHEVLFLLERSPKHSSKRRKRSKKERDKVKEGNSKDDSKEISSAL